MVEYTDGNLYYGVKCNTVSTSNATYTIYYEDPFINKADRFVKNGGNDYALGRDWDTAWARVNTGMARIESNATLRVGFGNYTDEPANNTLSPDNSDVRVIYETATTGGGTGTAIVEVN